MTGEVGGPNTPTTIKDRRINVLCFVLQPITWQVAVPLPQILRSVHQPVRYSGKILDKFQDQNS